MLHWRAGYPARVTGYNEKLFILAFDHRGSFQKKFFGIEGEPNAEQVQTISDAKHLIFEGVLAALEEGAEAGSCGALVDEQFGGEVPSEAQARGIKLAMPVEKSGQNVFDFDYGDAFGEHIERFAPDFVKVLVRYNPDDDGSGENPTQLERLKRLSDWLVANDRRFLFELLVPATDAQLASVDGDSGRYDRELRPELMRRAIEEIQSAGIVVDIWKIEGIEDRADCEIIARTARSGAGNEGVACVVLGRGADSDQVEKWLQAAAPVEGYIGFAIGRSIWWDPLKAYVDGQAEREDAAREIAQNYLRFVSVYEGTPAHA
jgi:5-dehydro-2-deoxygluconokinase